MSKYLMNWYKFILNIYKKFENLVWLLARKGSAQSERGLESSTGLIFLVLSSIRFDLNMSNIFSTLPNILDCPRNYFLIIDLVFYFWKYWYTFGWPKWIEFQLYGIRTVNIQGCWRRVAGDIPHSLWRCAIVKDIWKISGFKNLMIYAFDYLCTISWQIWHFRNSALHGGSPI